mgnify:CR=1 FL=1
MIEAIITIAVFAFAFMTKGSNTGIVLPAWADLKNKLRDKSWWWDRALDGKVLSTAIVFVYGLIFYADFQGFNTDSIPEYDLSFIPALALAAGWLIAVAPSMGEEYGSMLNTGPYVKHSEDFGREYGIKKTIQRGVFMGAAMTLATGSVAFIWASLAYMPIAFIALNAGKKYNFSGWGWSELFVGAICFGVPMTFV